MVLGEETERTVGKLEHFINVFNGAGVSQAVAPFNSTWRWCDPPLNGRVPEGSEEL